ncbi:MAG: lysophospholipid acyltransferase family protein [Thermodesulfobacteriota bacterium]
MLRKVLFNIYFWPMFVLVTIIGVLVVSSGMAIYSLTGKKNEAVLLRRSIKVYGQILIRWIPFFGPVTLVENENLKAVPAKAIFVTNHCSAVDPYCFAVVPGDFSFLTSWPFKIPVYKWFMKKAQYLDSRQGWSEVQRQGTELLNRGCSLLIWPEGHRSRDGNIGKFQNGAFRLACETGYPVVPIFISGSGKLLPPGQRFLTPSRVRLKILKTCHPSHPSTSKKDVTILRDQVREMLLAEQKAEETENG